ncbi:MULTISPECIES: chlorinating enzyme [Streptomyces]|uniref:chlorinating enzyme n=1 Tax=Streptomyces TaxID=1883 RepID=UPI0029A2FE00|nr:chlorinating enzyme [Streptomyces sp. ND04-05B]MDX3063306.1 chlorinating enzyme [Streptomyces sp. ND04-05B]
MDLEAERRQFDEKGFMGPFKLWEPDVMTAWWKEQRAYLLDPANKSRAVFDNPVNYDRHLDVPGLGSLISEPAIVERMQSVIGPDVLCWRTEFFPKNPGESGTGWHQVETYAIGEAEKGMLEPGERTEGVPMELTAWVAFTEATKENGCLKMIPGSHRSWKYDETAPISWNGTGKDNTFFGYDYGELRIDKDWNPDEEEVVHHEMAPGEVVLFTARCIHGSNPNNSRRQRMGFSVRVVPPTVRVYGGMTEFDEFGHHFDLSRHGSVLLAGQDDYGLNTMRTANAWDEPFTTRPRSA